jgi:hypothetical protein
MADTLEHLEQQLNDFDPAVRRAALVELARRVDDGEIALPESRLWLNLHGHSFFSFNGYGYSPSFLAWRSKKEGLLAAGLVDFDVLDGVDEFLEAGRLLNLRVTAGMETRVFVPQFADKVINSPGEPGVAYYMVAGFPSGDVTDRAVLDDLKSTAQRRNLGVVARVNDALDPVRVDYERDVLSLTPAGNVTERHLCMAYDEKARKHFSNEDDLVAFWAGKLGADPAAVRKALAFGPDMQGLIRAKTMKAGGVGYVKPEGPDFPTLEAVAKFGLAQGGIPMFTWLDGTSDGEQEIERLLDVSMEVGSAAANIIPDRNWNIKDPDVKQKKVALFDQFVALCQERDLPIGIGTEMNAYGQLFVDDFDAPEMQKHAAEFVKGAQVFHAHTLLQRAAGMGYLSPWAKKSFDSVREKNAFFAKFGEMVDPVAAEALDGLHEGLSPEEVAALVTT